MELKTFQYTQTKGWSIESFPDMDSPETLVLVFAAPEYSDHPEPLREIATHYSHSKIIGCSTAGEIAGNIISDHSISVAVIKFNKTSIALAKYKISSVEESYVAGKDIANQLSSHDLRGIFIISEGIKINGSELVKGVNEGVQEFEHIVVTGGLAGDGAAFKETWTICNGLIDTQMVLAIGFYGPYIKIGHASRAGWDTFGPVRRITRATNNILYELDDKPALTLYKKYLGEKSADLPASGLLFPLAIRKDLQERRQLVRTILGIDEVEQSLIFAGDIPVDHMAQLMHANFDRLVISASEAAITALESIGNKEDIASVPLLSIAISCVGRRLLMGERTVEEVESVIESLPPQTLQVGFYSYGEISPSRCESSDLHNQTMTLSLFCELDNITKNE